MLNAVSSEKSCPNSMTSLLTHWHQDSTVLTALLNFGRSNQISGAPAKCKADLEW